VIDRNLFEIEPAEISETRVLLSLLAGEPVHGDFSLSSRPISSSASAEARRGVALGGEPEK
jgi:hypothetical protein